MLERGEHRLVVDGERQRVELVEGEPATRQLVACEHWPIVAARRRVLCGLYEAVLISVGASGQLAVADCRPAPGTQK